MQLPMHAFLTLCLKPLIEQQQAAAAAEPPPHLNNWEIAY
jgi:hypothetical protein